MKRLLALLMLMTMPLCAEAATWSWTDASGTVHFTDDPGAVPKKFRRKAKQVDGDAAAPAASQPTRTAAEKQPVPAAARPALPEEPPAAAPPAAGAATRYGDRTAGEWQAEFRSMRKRIKEIEQQFEQAKVEGGDGKTVLRRERIEELNARNKKLNEEFEAVRQRFNQLAEQANKVGLPPEFAQ